MSKILLIDDDEIMLTMLKFKLEKENFEVKTAVNGKIGISLVKMFKPDLIVTDLMMPNVSGLELTKHLRLDLAMDIPIIILSSAGKEKIVLHAFEMGANDFITKPFSPNELIVRINKILSRSYDQA